MKLKKGFITHTMMGEQIMVAAGPAAKNFHGMIRSNETAARIVDCLKKETTEDEIVEVLLKEYDVERDVVQRDVRMVIEKLKSIEALDD